MGGCILYMFALNAVNRGKPLRTTRDSQESEAGVQISSRLSNDMDMCVYAFVREIVMSPWQISFNSHHQPGMDAHLIAGDGFHGEGDWAS